MKKTVFKRTLCIIVAAVMLCSVFASTAAAASRCRCGHSPVIMVSGFGATALAEKQTEHFTGISIRAERRMAGFM